MPTKDEKPSPRVPLTDIMSAINDVLAVIDVVENLNDRVASLEDRLSELEAKVMSEPLLLNVTEAAQALGVSRTTVYKLIESGRLSARKFASSDDAEPRTVVLREDLKTFLANLPSTEGQPAS